MPRRSFRHSVSWESSYRQRTDERRAVLPAEIFIREMIVAILSTNISLYLGTSPLTGGEGDGVDDNNQGDEGDNQNGATCPSATGIAST
jgi:hypothetical protein